VTESAAEATPATAVDAKLDPVEGADHFSILAPVSRLVASKILRDDSTSWNIKFTENELTGAIHK
jgi:hypothetical protein